MIFSRGGARPECRDQLAAPAFPRALFGGPGQIRLRAESDDVFVFAARRRVAIAPAGIGFACWHDAMFLDHALTIMGQRRAQACTAGSFDHMNQALSLIHI